MFLFYLITLLYGSNSLPLSLLSTTSVKTSVNETKSNDNDLLAKIKSNPQKFVSEFQNLDPGALKHIISLLEELREKSVARENELVTDLNNKESALADANSNVITAGDALDAANQAVSDAETVLAQKNDAVTEAQGILDGKKAEAAAADADLTTKKEIHKAKQTEKNVAQTAHDDEVPDLNDEQQILTDVVNMLQGLHDKHKVPTQAPTQAPIQVKVPVYTLGTSGLASQGTHDTCPSGFARVLDYDECTNVNFPTRRDHKISGHNVYKHQPKGVSIKISNCEWDGVTRDPGCASNINGQAYYTVDCNVPSDGHELAWPVCKEE